MQYHTGPNGTMRDHMGPCGIIGYYMGPCGTMWDHVDHAGPEGTIWDHKGPYWSIWVYTGPYGSIQVNAGKISLSVSLWVGEFVNFKFIELLTNLKKILIWNKCASPFGITYLTDLLPLVIWLSEDIFNKIFKQGSCLGCKGSVQPSTLKIVALREFWKFINFGKSPKNLKIRYLEISFFLKEP